MQLLERGWILHDPDCSVEELEGEALANELGTMALGHDDHELISEHWPDELDQTWTNEKNEDSAALHFIDLLKNPEQ